MRVRNSGIDVESFGVEKSTSFKILASGKAFRLLSSNMYSRKIEAIVRELSCNALDSHRAAGRLNVPFEITFPTASDPMFVIRDYGTGMSRQKILTLYVTYFDSDKADSNDDIGGLGLGSKVPFSYSDQFTIISRQGGIAEEYLCYLTSDGCPDVLPTNTTDTREIGEYYLDEEGNRVESYALEYVPQGYQRIEERIEGTGEPDGFEVRVPCKSQDFWTFQVDAVKVLKRFEVKPVTNIALRYPRHTPSNSGTNWKIFSNVEPYGIFAIMGPVAYPIDQDRIPKNFPSFTGRMEIDFPIGSLDPHPGRESLSYDEITIENLEEGLDAVAEEINQSITDKIAACATYHEACQKASSLSEYKIDWEKSKVRWNGKVVHTKVRLDLIPNCPDMKLMEPITYRRSKVLDDIDVRSFYLNTRFYNLDAVISRKEIVKMINGNGVVVSGVDPAVFFDFTGIELKSLKAMIPPKVVKIKAKVNVRPYKHGMFMPLDDVSEPSPIYLLMNENKICVEDPKSDRYKQVDHWVTTTLEQACGMDSSLSRRIYLVPIGKLNFIPKHWINFKVYLAEFLKKLSEDQKLIEYMNNKGIGILPEYWKDNVISKGHILYPFAATSKYDHSFENKINFATRCEYQIRPGIDNSEKTTLVYPEETYPLLTIIASNWGKTKHGARQAADYIKMVDTYNSLPSKEWVLVGSTPSVPNEEPVEEGNPTLRERLSEFKPLEG